MAPSDPGNESKEDETNGDAGPRTPDRARIDSNVRALLREPSTPWIVFDKDSRVDHQELRASFIKMGQMLRSAMSSVMSDTGAFTSTTKPEEPPAGPSGMTVASDVKPEPASTIRPTSIDIEVDVDEAQSAAAAPPPARGHHAAWLAIAGGTTALVVAGVLAFADGRSTPKPAAARAAPAIAAPAIAASAKAAPAKAAQDISPPETSSLDDVKPAQEEREAKADEPKAASPSKAAAKGKHSPFGRLVIKGDARFMNVFFDGKRMLGRGARSFTVLCGSHTIAVGDKTDARDVDIPCDTEYYVKK